MINSTTHIADNADYALVGVVVGVHGIRGAVKVKTFTEIPEDIFFYELLDSKGNMVELVKMSASKGTFIVKLNNIIDRNEAEMAKGMEFFISRADLPKLNDGEYYQSDLVGMTVVLTDGTEFGAVKEMHNFGAGELVEIVLKDTNKTEVYHFENDVISVNMDSNIITLELPTYVETGESK